MALTRAEAAQELLKRRQARQELDLWNKSIGNQPGMEIAADIICQEESVLTFILRKARLLTDL